MDNSYSMESKPPRLFALMRKEDETGISGTGIVCLAALFQSGKVVAQWRPKREGKQGWSVYNDMREFRDLHINVHGNKNVVVSDPANTNSMRCFYVLRSDDTTKVSRIGRILEGVMFPSGMVAIEWRPPMSTVTLYPDFEGLKEVQLSHPSRNEVIYYDNVFLPKEMC